MNCRPQLFAFVLPVLMVLSVVRLAVAAERDDNISRFMQGKLVHSQKVLEALATEDFEAIGKHARQLSLLSQASEWLVFETPEYRQHSVDFRNSVDDMAEAAKNENIDGAALGYVNMTLKCIACHKYVRRVRMAALPLDSDHRRLFAEREANFEQRLLLKNR